MFRETTETAIEACEAAWAFFHGVFRVLIPDNTKTIVQRTDPLEPRLTFAFLEDAQARGFVIDPTRVRRPRDKARVERAVPTVRDDCFAGEVLLDLAQARTHAVQWCREDYGVRRHSRTLRPPREHFETVEQPALRPAPPRPTTSRSGATPRSPGISMPRWRAGCPRLERVCPVQEGYSGPARGTSGAPWRAPVGLDHQPHREEEDELRGATRAAVVTPDPRGAGRDVTQPYDGAVAAVRAPTVAGFW